MEKGKHQVRLGNVFEELLGFIPLTRKMALHLPPQTSLHLTVVCSGTAGSVSDHQRIANKDSKPMHAEAGVCIRAVFHFPSDLGAYMGGSMV